MSLMILRSDLGSLGIEVGLHYGSRPDLIAEFMSVHEWVGQAEALDLLDKYEFLIQGCGKLGEAFNVIRASLMSEADLMCELEFRYGRR